MPADVVNRFCRLRFIIYDLRFAIYDSQIHAARKS